MNAPLLLIVDDSRTSRMLIRKMIAEQRPNWRISEAASGNEALEQIKHEPPDFVSMDVNMPGMSGLEAAGHIRLDYPNIRLILCTANVQESVRTAAERVGVLFVSKPITPQNIALAIAHFEA